MIWDKIQSIFSWVFLLLMCGLLVFSVYNLYQARQNNEGYFLFGYRPMLVLTGSMEPYMMTNSLVLSKEVTDSDQLEVGDVVTYHVKTESGRPLRITHRIVEMEDDLIYTKGDNNQVTAGFALTRDNIDAKVVGVCNFTATLASIWNRSLSGKITLVCCTAAVLLALGALRSLLHSRRETNNGEAIP